MSPERSTAAANSIIAAGTAARGVRGTHGATTPPSDHDTSAGRIKVATCPGGPYDAATAGRGISARILGVDAPPNPGRDVPRHRVDVGLQRRVEPSRDTYAWSPMIDDDRMRDCDERCAGWRGRCPARSEMQEDCGRQLTHPRRDPSAAPVAAPSKSASTPRISGTTSRVATKCISDVPGFANTTSTPEATSAANGRPRRRGSSARRTRGPARSIAPGLRMPSGSNAALILAHEGKLRRILEGKEVAAACRCRCRAPPTRLRRARRRR